MKRRLTYLLFFLILPFSVFAQNTYTIQGKVVSKADNSTLPGANVILQGTTIGNATRPDGTFIIADVPTGSYSVRVSYVGYSDTTITVNVDRNINMGTIALAEYQFSKEVIISAKRAQFRKTPVAFSTVDKSQLQNVMASQQDLSMATANIPNVYATESSGGVGDSRLTIRGFDDNNVGILINGVPVNDMESGHMYWSDWAGIAQVTNSIQVTKGMGANPLSTHSVGGTVNISTSSLNANPGGTITEKLGDFGMNETTISYSTGIMNSDNGGKFGVSALLSRRVSNSYFDYSHYEGFTYFFTVGYSKGNNTMNLTVLGSPQIHDQRYSALPISTWSTYGHNYNPNIGVLGSGNSQRFINEDVNYYHKPVFSFDDTYRINDKSLLTGTLYYSYGSGWGTGPLSQYGYYVNSDPQTGYLDFNQLFADNTSHADTVYNAQGKIVNGHGSQSILYESHNDHSWAGFVADFTHHINDHLTVDLSADGRDYVGKHYRTVRNLLGGDFWVENLNPNQNYDNSGYGGTGNIAYYPGDKIQYYDLGYVKKIGGNLQLEYSSDTFSAFADGSLSNTGYARKDYYILNAPKTPFYNFTGYTVKGGANVNLTDHLNIYANAGYNSLAPYFSGVFRYTNDPIQNAHNEKVTSFEGGIGYQFTNGSTITFDAYHTRWADQTFNVSAPAAPGSSTYNFYNVTGLNEIHKGIEAQAHIFVSSDLSVRAGLAVADNYYVNDVSTAIFNQQDQQVGTATLYTGGLKVSASPQTQASFGFNYRFHVPGGTFFLNPRGRFNGDYYSSFNPDYRTSASLKGQQAWKMDPYTLIDLTTGYEFPINRKFAGLQSAELLFSLSNIMNATYFADAYDYDGTRNNARVFYGRPRTATFTFRVNF